MAGRGYTGSMEQVRIRIKGHLAEDWSDSLAGLTIMHTKRGETILSGSVRDQAALRGVLDTLADMGVDLISLSTKGGQQCESPPLHPRGRRPA
jgi:hypothetical protein